MYSSTGSGEPGRRGDGATDIEEIHREVEGIGFRESLIREQFRVGSEESKEDSGGGLNR
jgi:hypothetical protein